MQTKRKKTTKTTKTKKTVRAELDALRDMIETAIATIKPVNHGTPWLPEQDQILRQRLRAGETDLRPIALQLGRTPFAVFLQAVRLGSLVTEANAYKMWADSTKPPPTKHKATVEELVNALYAGRAL